ncbi:MAG: signal peptide peptidase SppA [Chthoniobacterales bacterium]
MSSKKSNFLTVFLFIILCISMFVNALLLTVTVLVSSKKTARSSFSSISHPHQSYEETTLVDGSASKKIAVIPLNGVIAYQQPGRIGNSMVEDIELALEQAADDHSIKGIVLSVDSPGGEVTASDVLYHKVKEFSEKKPVVVFINSIGASGAYYIACGANYLMSNPTSFTGSIGVIISTLNYQDLFGKVGLQSIVFKSGKFKDMLSGSREISPEESEYVQSLVMQSYDRFLGIVAESRKLDAEKLRNGPADGRILSGEDALAEKLIDQTGYVEAAYDKAAELAEIENPRVVRYEPRINFSSIFRLFGETKANHNVKVEIPGTPSLSLEPGRIYLLPSILAP